MRTGIRYADDTVLIAYNFNDQHELVNRIEEHSYNVGLNINIKKIKLMVITRKPQMFANARITFNGRPIEQVSKFKYLRTCLCEKWASDIEIKSRIEQVRNAFFNLRKVLTCTDFDLSLRLRFTRCYVWSVLLGGLDPESKYH